MSQIIYGGECYHHGILGQKWGVRRYQNEDGSLTEAGKQRMYNKDGTLTRKGVKFRNDMDKRFWDPNGNYTNRNKVYAKINAEAESSEEAKKYNELMNNRRKIVIKDKNGRVVETKLSYYDEDWSDPEKVVDKMVAEHNIIDAYDKKIAEVGRKYIEEVRGATLLDLGYKNTENGRRMLEELGIVNPK